MSSSMTVARSSLTVPLKISCPSIYINKCPLIKVWPNISFNSPSVIELLIAITFCQQEHYVPTVDIIENFKYIITNIAL